MTDHEYHIRARVIILVLCVGEWVFGILYAQHGDLMPLYVIIAAFAKEHIHRRAKHTVWNHREENVTFAKGLK